MDPRRYEAPPIIIILFARARITKADVLGSSCGRDPAAHRALSTHSPIKLTQQKHPPTTPAATMFLETSHQYSRNSYKAREPGQTSQNDRDEPRDSQKSQTLSRASSGEAPEGEILPRIGWAPNTEYVPIA